MKKSKQKTATKREMIYAINVLIKRAEEAEGQLLMLTNLLHSYIECNEHVEKLKDFLQKKQETIAKEKEKDNAS